MWEGDVFHKTESYVEAVVRIVALACDEAKISEGCFWYWLGNTKFRQDKNSLSSKRALEIENDVKELIKEFCRVTTE